MLIMQPRETLTYIIQNWHFIAIIWRSRDTIRELLSMYSYVISLSHSIKLSNTLRKVFLCSVSSEIILLGFVMQFFPRVECNIAKNRLLFK